MSLRPFILLVALAAALPLRAEPLGRLFLTPERRALLEHQRRTNVQETQALEGSTLSLDGVVVRSGGKSTVWINGRPQHDDTRGVPVQAGVTPREPGRARLAAGEEAPADLRVGESINMATREKSDVVAPGAVSVRKPRVPPRQP
jgi:hypothetical protein